jgi:hypothetical protein
LQNIFVFGDDAGGKGGCSPAGIKPFDHSGSGAQTDECA